jgi:Zn-dependent M16 (insulinase) family peptidase
VLYESLFPDLTYGHNSGGNPHFIPDLTYDELLNFHKTYYHPSCCLFFFYGNMPLEKHLDFIENHTLKGVKKETQIPPVPLQPRFKHPVRKEIPYPISQEQDTQDQTLIAMAWLTCSILEQEELLALSVLNIVLMGNDAAPLKYAFLQSGLCKQASAWMDTDISEVPFVLSFKGCNPENAEPLEKLTFETLKKIAEEGVPLYLIENAIHQIEFHRSEITGDSSPYGLSLFMRSALIKQHGGLPEDGLKVHSLCDALNKKFQDNPKYIGTLIGKFYLNNPHFVRISLVPNKDLAEFERKQEQQKLDTIGKQIDREKVLQQTHDLAVFQQQQLDADSDILPKITLASVPKETKDFPLTEENIGNFKVFHHETFTNKIVYADITFPLPEISEEDLSYVQLFSILLSQIGCGGRDYGKNLEFIQANTGGVSVSAALNRQAQDSRTFFPSLTLHGKALYRKGDKLFQLLQDMIQTADFTDMARIKEIIFKQYAGLRGNLVQNALRYAMNLSSSGINIPSHIANYWGGLKYYWKIQELAENFQPEVLLEKLLSFQKRLLSTQGAHLVLTCDGEKYAEMKKSGFYGMKDIPCHPFSPWKSDFSVETVPNQGRVIASPVAFTCKSFESIPYVHPDSPSLSVASHLFDTLVLHPEVREKGGAYGSHAHLSATGGIFSFYSYRDPNISRTLSTFKSAIDKVMQGQFSDAELEEAKLEIFQGLDSPISPGSRGFIEYTWLQEGKPKKVRQAWRERLMNLTKKDVIEAVKKHLEPKFDQGTVVVFAGNDLLQKENALLAKKGEPALKIEQT